MTVRQLLASMDSEELTHWMGFERIEPFGGLVEDFRAGQVASTVFNMARVSESAALSASDFFPALKRALHGEPEPEEEMADIDPLVAAQFLDAMFGFQ